MNFYYNDHLISYEQVQNAAKFIREKFETKSQKPIASIGIVLGSGLGHFVDTLRTQREIQTLSYQEIPGFPVSSIAGHASQFHWVQTEKQSLLIMQGRIHRYEGYSASQVSFPIRVMIALGMQTVILTNAAAAIKSSFEVGDLMLIEDHINFTGDSPLLGPNDLRFGPRFPDMTECYSKRLRNIAKKCASKLKISLQEGVYMGVLGPCYETPAEIRMFKKMGADACGMSTVFETIAARHNGIEVLGISCLTNKGAGLSKDPISHEEVTQNAQATSSKFTSLLMNIIKSID